MSGHPYWSYGPDTDGGYVAMAHLFEACLRGEEGERASGGQ